METYDKKAAGERIRSRRTLLGLTQEELAEKIGRVPKYCADIERGQCGMSIETMLTFAKTLNMSLDYLIFGNENEKNNLKKTDELTALIHMMEKCPAEKQKYAVQLLKLFLVACS